MARKAQQQSSETAVVADLTEYEAPKGNTPKTVTDCGNGTKREDY